MSNYTFTFKKGDIIVEFTTTDKLAVERQFPIWVASASEAAKKVAQNKQVQAEEKKTPDLKPAVAESFKTANVVEETVAEQVYVETEVPSQKEIQQEDLSEEPVRAEVTEASADEIKPRESAQVFDKASDLLKTINTIQNPSEGQPIKETVDFEKVLEESIENPTFEPNQTKDEKFLDVVTSKGTSDRFHYLIITAYYLLEHEKMERFSLKQINAKLMHNLSRVVDHSILREAINKDLIEVVPDLTGSSQAAEYRLTEKGEDFFLHKIN